MYSISETEVFIQEPFTFSLASTIISDHTNPASPKLLDSSKKPSIFKAMKKIMKFRLKFCRKTGKQKLEKIAFPTNISDSLECEEILLSNEMSEEMEKLQNTHDLLEENYNHMIMLEEQYKPNLTYFLENQKLEIDWFDRAKLIHWLMFFGSDVFMKKTTIYTMINYLDRYIEVSSEIEKKNMQYIGLAALLTASKMEEISPKSIYFKDLIGLNIENIVGFEINLLKKLKFKLNPPVLPHWADFYMRQWDSFIEYNIEKSEDILRKNQKEGVFSDFSKIIQFKEGKTRIYHQCFEIFDCLILDTETLKYEVRGIAMGVIFVILGKYYCEWKLEEFYERLKNEDISENSLFCRLFNEFSGKFSIEFNELLPYLAYISEFMGLKLNENNFICNIFQNNDLKRKSPQMVKFICDDIYRAQVYNPDCLRMLMKRNNNL